MLVVTNLDGSQVEPLTHHQGLRIEEEVSGGFTLSFTSFNIPENYGYSLLVEESVITVDDHEFRVKQLTENRFSKSVVATHTFFDLSDQRQDSIYGGTHTLNEFVTFALNGTGWTFTTDITDSALIENFGEANVILLINSICAAFNCEYKILPNKTIHFAYQTGPDNDAQYRYKHNVVAISKKVDTTKLKTFIEGYGANGLYTSYTSPNHQTFGIRKAEPIRDDRFTNAESLIEHIKSQLIDSPEVLFELDEVELNNKEIGERVWLIYEPLNIEFQTRILKHVREVRNGNIVTTSVVLGNALPRSTIDLLVSQKVEINENKKQVQSKFEQTNERITIEVESVNDSIAAIEVRAGEIESTVSSQSATIGGLQSQITQQAGEISSKITSSEAESIFTQSASSFTFSASQINFNGHVFGQGATFSGNISTTQNVVVGNNITLGTISDYNSQKEILFNGSASIHSTGFQMGIIADNFTFDVGSVSIIGGLFSLKNVSSIDWGAHKPVATWG